MYRNKFQFCAKVLFLLSLTLVSMTTSAYSGYFTNLVFNGYIQDSSGDIDVGMYSAPVVFDWNSDGKKDLLVGQRLNEYDSNNNLVATHGYVSYYENVGTNASPVFSSPDYIEACNTVCNYLDVIAGG